MSRPVRVVYDHQIFTAQTYGGISRYICELAERVNASEHFGAAIVAPVHFNSHLAQSSAPRSGVHLSTQSPRIQRLCRGASRLLAPPLNWARSPSLIHRTFYKPLGRHRKLPLVLTVHDMIHEIFSDQFRADDPVVKDKRRSIDQADHILCVSESTARDLKRLFGTPADKISVTHLGYSSVFDAPPDLQSAPSAGRPYLLYVGHREGYKNFAKVLKAYSASRLLQAELDLMLFGGPGLDSEELQMIENLGVRASQVIHRQGSDIQLARAYRAARAFVYPSMYEGFGIPPLEAMASGCPVVCSNASSIPEVVGDAARQFDAASIDEIRQALEDVCLNSELHAKLSADGKQRAKQFSWDRCAAETMAAYTKLSGVGAKLHGPVA